MEENKLSGDFKMIGLERLRTEPEYMIASLEHYGKEGTFKARLDMPNDRKEALWNYLEGNWYDKPKATVKYEATDNEGNPIGGLVVSIEHA